MASLTAEKFLAVNYGSGDGSGAGYGDGSGYGSGDGAGDGSGAGYGCGNGAGYGPGAGSGCGYGAGSGCGYGNGDGDGDGDGAGAGYGYGSGAGAGYGYGSGDGAGIKSFCGNHVHDIDGIQTVLHQLRPGLAKASILQADLTLKPCWVARVGDSFAHGDTAEDAIRDATDKHNENLLPEDRVALFLKSHPPTETYSGHDLFDAHKQLTGSCLTGREQFVRDRGVDLDRQYTLAEFCALCRDAYGGEVIQLLERELQAEPTGAEGVPK